MKEYIVLAYYAIICIASIVFMYFALDAADNKKLNCSIAEISPDFSVQDRQRCRDLHIRQASQKHNL
jgi:hypothetical protein